MFCVLFSSLGDGARLFGDKTNGGGKEGRKRVGDVWGSKGEKEGEEEEERMPDDGVAEDTNVGDKEEEE